MTDNDVNNELEKINNYLAKTPWMDFELVQINPFTIKICGCIDTTYNETAIEIVFEQPHFISCLLDWTYENKKPFIQLAPADEEFLYNSKYKVEIGNYIFKISGEDVDDSAMAIAAKKYIAIFLLKIRLNDCH